MPYEVPLLISLGFEVFTPKMIPKRADFRSAVVDHSYDASLTIPPAVLARLNEFDFYTSEWPADIVALVNRYFGTAYTIPYSIQVREVVRKFEGQVMFRAFGLDNSQTYERVLQNLFGFEIFADIYALGRGFWFAQGYEQLAEVEPPLIADRAIFLPIGVPNSFWKTENSWTGIDRRILFACPNCVTNPYYAKVYREFKRDFGHLPHVIIGAQDVPVNDPNVLGFVSDEELARLYRECAVLYYHSVEWRHVHYPPIEAAINGMPVVYHVNSLIGRMTPEIRLGRSITKAWAMKSVERILEGDEGYVAELRAEQRGLAHKFSDAYCRAEWEKSMLNTGYAATLEKEAKASTQWREFKRAMLRPIAHGLSTTPPKHMLPLPPPELLSAIHQDDGTTLADGIDFTRQEYPWFVRGVTGLSANEPWGRWSVGPKIDIALARNLPRRFRLVIEGGGYGPNIGEQVTVKVGKAKRSFTFSAGPGARQRAVIQFSMRRPSNMIHIEVPRPVTPPNDNRAIGLGLTNLRIEALR
jgi:hypothetical protein